MTGNTAWYLGARISSWVLGYLVLREVNRACGPGGAGDIGVALFSLGVGMVVLDLGLGMVLVRDMAAAPSGIASLAACAVRARLAGLLPVLLLAIALGAVSAQGQLDAWILLPVVCLALACHPWDSTYDAVFRAREHPRPYAWAQVAGQAVLLCWTASVLRAGGSLALAAAGFPLSALVRTLIARAKCRPLIRATAVPGAAATPSTTHLLAQGTPFLLMGITGFVLFRVGVPVIYHLHGRDAAGVFQNAFVNITALLFIPASIFAALFPVFSRLVAQGSPDLARVYGKSLAGLTLLGVGVSAVGWALAPLPIHVLCGHSPGADESIRLLRVMVLFMPMSLWNSTGIHLLQAAGRTWWTTWITAATLAVNVGANLLLVPAHGAMGAAYALLVSELFQAPFYAILPWRELRRRSP